MANEIIKLNLIPEGEMPVFHCSQFDNGRPITIELYNGEDAYTPAGGLSLELRCRKCDRNIVTLASTSVVSNVVTFTSTKQLTACSGDNEAEIRIKDSNSYVLGTLNFIIRVEKDPTNGGLTSATAIHDLTTQITDIATEIIGNDYYNKTESDDRYVQRNALNIDLDDLTDVNITTPENGQVLKYDAASDKWVNATGGGGEPGTNDYTDLINKPSINSVTLSGNKTTAELNISYNDLSNKPTLATVATSGSYTDLTDKPEQPVKSATGNIASFTTQITLPLIESVCDIPYLSTGYTSISVTHCGKNLFSYDLPIHVGYWSGTAYVGDDSIITLDNATGWDNIRIPVAAGSTITISGMQAQSGVYSAFLGSDNPNDIISKFLNASTNGTKTVPDGAKFLSLCAYNMKANASTYSTAQVEVGFTPTTYDEYNGQSYNVSWQSAAGTIYGGSIDLASGSLISSYNSDGTEKSTPDTYSLTPVVIEQIIGINNIFGNVGGQITVKYSTSIAQDIVDIAKANLAKVATTGSYNDLSDRPAFTDITSLVTFNETPGGGTKFYYKDGALYLNFQSAAGAHALDDLLFTLPIGYRPSTSEIIFPMVVNAIAYGNVKITGATGQCIINSISTTTTGGRIYFNAVIPL